MADPYGKGPRNKNILKKIGIGEGKLPNVEFKRKNPDTGKMEKLDAIEIRNVLEEEEEAILIVVSSPQNLIADSVRPARVLVLFHGALDTNVWKKVPEYPVVVFALVRVVGRR